jgi:hypothetical protein
MLRDSRTRAARKGLPHDITLDDIPSPTHCPVFGIPLDWGSRSSVVDASPSLDRVVNELGYVKGNVQVISSLANRMKQGATSKQIAQVFVYLAKHRNDK